MFGRGHHDFYFPRPFMGSRFPSWMDDDMFFGGGRRSFWPGRHHFSMFDDDDWSPFHHPSPFRHRRRLFDMDCPFERRRPRPSFFDHHMDADFGLGFEPRMEAVEMAPNEVRVKLLPDGRMAVTGNQEQNHEEDGRSFRSSRKFYRSMDVPDDMDVGYLKSMMDHNNELTIQRAPVGYTPAIQAGPPVERIIEVQVEGR